MVTGGSGTEMADIEDQSKVQEAMNLVANLQRINEEEEERIVQRERKSVRAIMGDLITDDPNLIYKRAAYCIEDALAGRYTSGRSTIIGRPSYVHLAFIIQTSRVFQIVYNLVVVMHSLAAFFEESMFSFGMIATGIAIATYAADLAMVYTYSGFKNMTKAKHQVATLVMFILLFIDMILMATRLFQPFRFVRPWMIIPRDMEMKRVVAAIIHMIPTVLKLFAFIFLYMMFFAAIGVAIFMNDYNRSDVYIASLDNVDNTGAFNNMGNAMIQLFTFITTENFPDAMMPAFRAHQRSFVYFGVYEMTSIFFILPMVLAVVMVSR